MTRPYARWAMLATAGLVVSLAASPAGAASVAAPGLTSLSAGSGPLTGGQRISLHGSGFSHVSKVLFGGAAAHSIRVTSTRLLTVVVPAHKAGRVDVRVITPGGESKVVKADRFGYIAPPTITSVKSTTGPATGGTRVTVKGKNLTHVKAVLFGKTKGSKIHVVSSTTLLVAAPTHSPGVVDVHVTTAYGTSRTVKADHFTYLATTPVQPTPPPTPPVIASINLPDATQAMAYAGATFTATSGVTPYTWTAHGLPGGLSLTAAGVLSGTTYASAGLKALRVTVTDAVGQTVMSLVTMRVVARAASLFGWGPNGDATLGDGTQTTRLMPFGALAGADTVSMCSEKKNSFAVHGDGSVSGWGRDDQGQLGDDATALHANPLLVSAGFGVDAVACASDTMYELTSTGQVYALGVGSMGETGSGSTSFNATPMLIASLSHVIAIAAGEHHALALLDNGTVYAWGDNTYGQLGVGAAPTMSASPVLVPGLTDITSIAAGGWFSFALHSDGTVYGWGLDSPYVLLGDGSINNRFTPVTIPGLADITQIATSGNNSYAVKDDGTLWSWGAAGNGALGNGTMGASTTPVQASVSGIAAVGTSDYNAFAVTTTGTALAWGAGAGTGNNDPANVATPTVAPWLSETVSFGLGRTDAFAIRLKPLEN